LYIQEGVLFAYNAARLRHVKCKRSVLRIFQFDICAADMYFTVKPGCYFTVMSARRAHSCYLILDVMGLS